MTALGSKEQPGKAIAADGLNLVDCHTHVVSNDHERYPLHPRDLSGTWYLDAPASAADLADEMDASGVAQAVLVQGVGAYTYDNRYAADAAREAPERFVSACAIDVEARDAVEVADEWIRVQGMQGIRLFALSREGPSWLANEQTFPVWRRAADLDAHIIITILPHQLDELDRVLTHFPETNVSLDHCAFAMSNPDSRARLYTLARHSNLHLKVTTHNLDDAARSGEGADGLVQELVTNFGADRMMWGSDYCQTHDRTYPELVALAHEAFSGLSAPDRRACLSGTARRLWLALAQRASA